MKAPIHDLAALGALGVHATRPSGALSSPELLVRLEAAATPEASRSEERGPVRNPLVDLSVDIDIASILPEHIRPAVKRAAIAAQLGLRSILEKGATRDYETAILPLATLRLKFERLRVLFRHLVDTGADALLRERALEGLSELPVRSFRGTAGLRRGLMEFAASEEAFCLDAARRHTLDEILRLLDDEPPADESVDSDHDELSSIARDLSVLAQRYESNLEEDAEHLSVFVEEDEGLVAGVSSELLLAAAERARSKDSQGYAFEVVEPEVSSVMKEAESAELRQRIFEGYLRRGTLARASNVGVATEMLTLRHALARCLGAPSFLDYVGRDRIVRSPNAALADIRSAIGRVRPRFERERVELALIADASAGAGAAREYSGSARRLSDLRYLIERSRRERFGAVDREASAYFSLDVVLGGIFDLIERAFGVVIRAGDRKRGWHPDVRVVDLAVPADRADCAPATLYLDLLRRPGKRRGTWMNGVPFDPDVNERRVAWIVADFAASERDVPALLSLDEVIGLAHEFGHLLHFTFSRRGMFAMSPKRLAWDVIEFSACLFERWWMEPEILARYGRHADTDRPIPRSLVEQLLLSHGAFIGHEWMEFLAKAEIDLMIHASEPLGSDEGSDEVSVGGSDRIVELSHRILTTRMEGSLPERAMWIASAGNPHLFGAPIGYAGGFGCYLFAKAAADDVFGAFRDRGAPPRELGECFSRTFLERANHEDPITLYRELMGRDPSFESWFRRFDS